MTDAHAHTFVENTQNEGERGGSSCQGEREIERDRQKMKERERETERQRDREKRITHSL